VNKQSHSITLAGPTDPWVALPTRSTLKACIVSKSAPLDGGRST